MGKYFEALPFLNFQKQIVSGSKLKCPSKVSWEVSFSLYYSVIYGNCLENVVVGMEKCGKMCENVEKMWKNVLETRFLYTTNNDPLPKYGLCTIKLTCPHEDCELTCPHDLQLRALA